MIGKEDSQILAQDHYYRDQSHLFDEDGGAVNFDHPDALDFERMAEDVERLKNGEDVEIPSYDFSTHKRRSESQFFPCKKVIIIEGTLILSQEVLRPHFHHSVYLEESEEVRFDRRLKRDVEERGRSPEGVKKQFDTQVAPMHNKFIEPSKKFATTLIDNPTKYEESLIFLLNLLSNRLKTDS